MEASSSSSNRYTEPNPFLRTYDDWRNRTPLVCRYLSQGILVSYSLSWFVDTSWLVANIPYKVLYKLQLYRLILSPAAGNSLLGSLFAVLTIGDGVGPRLERSLGSISFFFAAVSAIICINCAYTGILSSLAIGGAPNLDLIRGQGIWPLVMYFCTIEALSGPETRRKLLCLPIEIPRYYYPLALLLLFFFMAGLQLDFLLGAAVGYADFHRYLSFIKPSVSFLSRIESVPGIRQFVGNDPCFVSARGALGSDAWVQFSESAPWATDQDQRSQQPSMTSSFLNAIRSNTIFGQSERGGASNGSTDATNHNFPHSSQRGHILGSAPASFPSRAVPQYAQPIHSSTHAHVDQQNPIQVAIPVQTAAENRATILAAVEKRTAPPSNNDGRV